MLDRYFEARARGDQRVAVALEARPYSCLFGFALMMSVVAATIYLGAFTDSRQEFWAHLWQSLGSIVVLAVIFGCFYRREKRSALPLRVRRWLWQSIVVGYLIAALWLVVSLFQPYARMQLVRTILSLGTILPLPFTAWQLLRKTRNG